MAKSILSGIYRIDGPTGKFYVGSAKHIPRRWIEHKRDLRKGNHGNPKLQCAWNKHGESGFTLTVLERVPDLENLIPREQYWIDLLDAVDSGYNVLPTAGSNLGAAHSEETRRKMSEAHTGRKHGPMSDEQKSYYSELYKGRKLSEETRKKMGDARRGKPRPPHVIEAIRAANTGRVLTEEHKEKVAKANIGKTHSEETKAKMRDSHSRRKPISEETREKLRAASKRNWERRNKQQAA